MEPSSSKKRKFDEMFSSYYSSSSSAGSESIPSSPESPKRRIGDYEILKEFSYGDYVFESVVKDGLTFPVLSPVSDARDENGGMCSHYATTDVCETRMRIHEATSPPKTSSYFNNVFGATLSAQNLIDTGLDDDISGLLNYMTNVGVTSKDEYDKRSREEGGSELKDLTGCRKFKIDSWRCIEGRGVNVTVADIEGESEPDEDDDEDEDDDVELVTRIIRTSGPVWGGYLATVDNDMLCKQDIYDQTDSRPIYDPIDRVRLGHAVMLVGYGIARHVRTDEKVAYYVLQDNSGQGEENNKGRIRADILSTAAIPILDGQCDLEEFMLVGGNSWMKIFSEMHTHSYIKVHYLSNYLIQSLKTVNSNIVIWEII